MTARITERIEVMRKQLAVMKASAIPPESDKYRKAVEGICTDLRKAWERMVEEVLLNKTVERFDYGVKTQSLKGVLVEDSDHQQIYFAMKKLSNFTAHDEAAGKQGQLPTVDELIETLEELDTYRKTVDDRRKDTQKDREKLEKPPTANFA